MTNDTSDIQFDESQLSYGMLPTEIEGVYIVSTYPGDFDPLSVGDGELVGHGFPPALEAARKGVGPVRNRIIIPDMEVQVGVTHNVRKLERVTDTDYLSNNWAGSVVRGNFVGAQGEWFIPTVSKPGEPQGSEGGWNSSSWVGLDGVFGSNDVLQTGIEQRVDAAGNATYIPWYEWYAPPQPGSPGYIYQVNITTFSVRPGQEMSAIVAYDKTHTHGFIQLYNVWGTGLDNLFTIVLDPPPGASFNGDCAEWIMEAPDGGEPISSLPRFTPVTFTSAYADDRNDIRTYAGTDATFNISGFNTTLTAVSSDRPGDVTISYIGP